MKALSGTWLEAMPFWPGLAAFYLCPGIGKAGYRSEDYLALGRRLKTEAWLLLAALSL